MKVHETLRWQLKLVGVLSLKIVRDSGYFKLCGWIFKKIILITDKMNGKLVNVSINGQTVECHPDSSFELEHVPEPIGEISLEECDEISELKVGDNIKDITINDMYFSKGVVTRNENGKFYIEVYL